MPLRRPFQNIPILSESKHLSRLMWGVVALLVLAAYIFPRIDTSLQHDSPRADATPDPFAEEVVEIEQLLEAGELESIDASQALPLAPLLKARALTSAGPMTHGEMIFAAQHLMEYQPQIAAQPDRPSRETLRRHRNSLLYEELPRLDPQRGDRALDEVRQAYLEAFGVDPARRVD